MPNYRYKAVSAGGGETAGQLEAADRASALRELIGHGVSVLEIAEAGRGGGAVAAATAVPGAMLGGRVRPRQLAVLTRQLATSLEAGLPLMNALDVVGRELDNASLRHTLHDLAAKVQQGNSLSDALAQHPRVFEPMYVRLVRVGETGGMLDEVLSQLADMLERRADLRDRIMTASIYPAIVAILGLASVAVIVMFIVPRIISSMDAERFMLPLPTRVLLAGSDVLQAYWWLLLGGLIVLIAGWRQFVLWGPGRPAWDAFKLRVPILGPLIRQLDAARFSRGLGVLAKGGVSITEALAVVRDTIQNHVMREAVEGLTESIQSGEPIAAPLQRTGLFPPLLVQMVRVGENTGRLDEMLLRSAGIHETQARISLDRLVSVLPVLLILVLACIIGFIVAGLVLAIVQFQTTGMR